MTRMPILAVAAIGAFAGATMSHAQNTGTLVGPDAAQLPDYAGMSKEDRGRVAMYRYAECVVQKSRARVDAYLQSFPGSKQARDAADRLAVNECLSTGEMRFSEPLFRGGVYDVLYRKRFQKDGGTLDLSSLPAIDYTIGSEVDAPGASGPKVALRKLADCTVRQDSEASRALILSMVASNAENAAFEKIVPHMGGCLEQGTKLSFSKSVFRGVIGETLYRLSINASQPLVAVKD